MVVESWLASAARDAPGHRCRQRAHLRGAVRSGHAPRRPACRAARASALALPPGEDFVVALHACLLAGALVVPDRPAADRGRAAGGRPPCSGRAGRRIASERHRRPRPRRARDPRPHQRDHRAAQADPAHLRQLAVERAGLRGRARRRPRRALALHAAAEPRRRAVDPAALARSTARPRSSTSASTPIACSHALNDPQGPTVVSLVPTTLARLLDAGLASPPALRWALLGGAPLPPGAARASRRRGRPGRADLRPDRGLLAGRDRRRPALLHARRAPARRRDPRHRPDGVAGRRAEAAHRRPRRPRRRRPPAHRRAQGRHDRHRRRERRARRGRGGPGGPSQRHSKPRSSAAPTTRGARRSSRSSDSATVRPRPPPTSSTPTAPPTSPASRSPRTTRSSPSRCRARRRGS